MTNNHSDWILQPQEQEGSYFFSGQFYVTKGIEVLLSYDEIFIVIKYCSPFSYSKSNLISMVFFFLGVTNWKNVSQ